MSETFVEEVSDFVEGVFQTLEHDVEELFPPRPGGKVDTARKDLLRQQAYQEYVEGQTKTDQPGRGKPIMRHETVAAPVGGGQTFAISTTSLPFIQVAGFDATRKRAVIMTLDEPVVLSTSNAQAGDPRNAANAAGLSAGGFVLPVNVPFTSESASEIWAVATSSTATRVSVWTETYGS